MRSFAQAKKKNARRAFADRARSGPATRVEHLSDTLGPVGPLFSHRFRLGKHGFNRCFTRSVPGTGSSIWDPRLVASEFVGSGGPKRGRERKKERACETSDGARGRDGTGVQVYMPRDFGPISPVKPNSVRVQESWSSLCSALQFMAVITSIGLELD